MLLFEQTGAFLMMAIKNAPAINRQQLNGWPLLKQGQKHELVSG